MATAAPASTASVASELVELCRAGRNLEAISKLYDANIVSIEAVGGEEAPAETRGIDAVRKKNEWWLDTYEVNSAKVDGPFVGKDRFAVYYAYETTLKRTGERGSMEEMALYTVKDGKIVREQFFYNAPDMKS